MEYDPFYRWLLDNREATSISSWLLGPGPGSSLIAQDKDKEKNWGGNGFQLSDDHETPTFYQTLAGVTHRKSSFSFIIKLLLII